MATDNREKCCRSISATGFRILVVLLAAVILTAVAGEMPVAASAPQIAAGGLHTVALMSDGTVPRAGT